MVFGFVEVAELFKLVNSFFVFCFLFLFVVPAYSVEVCGWAVAYEITAYGMDCPASAKPYEFELYSGCSVPYSETADCISLYKVCCPDTTQAYEDTLVIKKSQADVPIGQEFQVAENLVALAQAEVVAPVCSSGYKKILDLPGHSLNISSSASDYTKNDVTVTVLARVGCSKFTSNTTISLNPIQTGGGFSAESLVELQAINTALSTIKTVLDNIPNSTNPLLTDIKTLLQTGLNFNSEALETGINQVAVNTNQVGVNTAAGNEILTAINNKLTQNCTTVWDPNLNCTSGDWDRDPNTPPTDQCTGENTTTCEGLDVSDSASLAKLQEIKDAIIAGQGQSTMGNYSGTVNIDLTETNSSLTQIKDFFSGSSTLTQHTDTSASKTAYSSSYFEEGIPTSQSYSNEFNSFVSDVKATPLYGLMGGFFSGVPTSAVSVVSFNGGRYGTHSYDFSSWGSILTVIKALVLIIFAAMSMKIIFLKGGSG